ncbi:MAG: 3-oxoacyl-ACP reductase, partial [Verrucomicrobia bacterium 61-8]
ITGGADGLGKALARKLVQQGVFVSLFDLNETRLRETSAELGESADWHVVDVTQGEQIRSAVEAVRQKRGSIEILVNSAGITGKTSLKSHEVPVDDFDRVLSLNTRGTFLCCQAVLPVMLSASYGRILNISSIAGKEGNAGMVAYSTSKAAVIGMTKSMGKEYAETGITVNALAPAVIQTALVDAMPSAQVSYMTDKIPMKRCGTLEEFADTAAFIVSPANSFTTGFTFDLSGGRAVY